MPDYNRQIIEIMRALVMRAARNERISEDARALVLAHRLGCKALVAEMYQNIAA